MVDRREDIADMYRRSDVFIDMSTWQGFGRSGAEAMSCGCIPIMPELGAASELCKNNACLFHESTAASLFYDSVVKIIKNDTFRRELLMNGMQRTMEFSL